MGLASLSCVSAAGQAGHDGGGGEGRPEGGSSLCARYQGLSTSPQSFTLVQRVFDDFCVSCHTGAGANVDLSDGRAWMDLVNHAAPAAETCGGVLVVPGDPTSSYLYQKLTEPHPCAGAQMPIDELFTSAPLPPCITGIVGDWIAAGAPAAAPDGGDAGGG